MKTTNVIPGYRTDHSAIMFTFSTGLGKRGKGYWKFNSQLLRDLEYVNKVKQCIKDTIDEYYFSGDTENFWGLSFNVINNFFLKFSR